MTREELEKSIKAKKIPEYLYNISGQVKERDCYQLLHHGDKWIVCIWSESKKEVLEIFDQESDANDYFFNILYTANRGRCLSGFVHSKAMPTILCVILVLILYLLGIIYFWKQMSLQLQIIYSLFGGVFVLFILYLTLFHTPADKI